LISRYSAPPEDPTVSLVRSGKWSFASAGANLSFVPVG